MAKSLADRVRDFLKESPEQRFTAREIAEGIILRDPTWARRKAERSQQENISIGDDGALIQQVVAEIGAIKLRLQAVSELRMTEDRPRKHYYTSASPDAEIKQAEESELYTRGQTLNQSDAGPSSFSEESLYPLVSKYLAESLAIYSKRVDEKRSRNSYGPSGNKWLYPDMIAFEILSRTWTHAVSELASMQFDKSTRLWSLEVKKAVNRANVREVFFQTVSNSSWANFSYLITAEISGAGTLEELRVLSNQHGVGVIQIDRDDPSESTILIPAKERLSVDWAAASRLAEQNSDAKEVFEHVKFFYQTRNDQAHFWDVSLGG